MIDPATSRPFRLDGSDETALASLLGLPRVVLRERVPSTMDLAHELASTGAPAGTLIVADRQTAGRGRGGRPWASPAGRGLWLTLVERPNDPRALEVLSLRLGLRAAAVLDRFAASPLQVKWPNDLYTAGGKLAGVLVEARWRDGHPDWAAIGFGLNVASPEVDGAAGLRPGTSRLDVLAELVPALRAATAGRGALTPRELESWWARDLARGRRCRAPAAGRVAGIDINGALLVATDEATVRCRGGSLVLAEDA